MKVRQEQKVLGVHNRKIIVVSILFLLLVCNKLSAQNDSFQHDFLRKFRYPEALRNSCTATFANLMVDISDEGTIDTISVSDSAPQIFKDEFQKVKSQLNLEFIRGLIIEKKLKNLAVIIPLFYVYSSNYCVNSFDSVGYLEMNYYKFNGKPLEKPVYILDPIIALMYKPIH